MILYDGVSFGSHIPPVVILLIVLFSFGFVYEILSILSPIAAFNPANNVLVTNTKKPLSNGEDLVSPSINRKHP
jgi:tripartite-type tricarboxylate transporter receptor subunit TctC